MSTEKDPGSRRSRAASARHGRACPTCGAGESEPCRARSGRVTDTHASRLRDDGFERSLTRNQGAVLAAVLHAEVPQTVAETAAGLGLSPASARSAMMGLQQRGLVRVVGSALSGGQTYGLTGAGRAW